MKTRFKTLPKNKQKLEVEKLLKNNNFRNNQNYSLSDYRYVKAYRYFSNYWLFNKYLHIEKTYNIKDYNQGLYILVGIMILLSYMLFNNLYSLIIYNIILFIIGLLFFVLNKYFTKKNRKKIQIYSDLREIIFVNNNFEKFKKLEKIYKNEDTDSFGYDID